MRARGLLAALACIHVGLMTLTLSASCLTVQRLWDNRLPDRYLKTLPPAENQTPRVNFLTLQSLFYFFPVFVCDLWVFAVNLSLLLVVLWFFVVALHPHGSIFISVSCFVCLNTRFTSPWMFCMSLLLLLFSFLNFVLQVFGVWHLFVVLKCLFVFRALWVSFCGPLLSVIFFFGSRVFDFFWLFYVNLS